MVSRLKNISRFGQRDLAKSSLETGEKLQTAVESLIDMEAQANLLAALFNQIEPFGGRKRGRPRELSIKTIIGDAVSILEDSAKDAGVDLMLSGHTHGGQIWPFGYLVKLRYPYVEGNYDINGMQLVVTRGAGTWGPRMRLWCAGEILVLKLRSPKQQPQQQ